MSSESSRKNSPIGIIILFILVWLVFFATGSNIKGWVRRFSSDEETSEDIGDLWVENYPWPHSGVDAVKKCILGIQSRNWQAYQGCFEPSTLLACVEPGLPGEFHDMHFDLLESDGKVGTVWVTGYWMPSPLTGISEVVDFSEIVTVVRARKGFLKDVDINVDVAIGGWFVAYTEKGKLPFDFSSRLSSLQATPTPERPETPSPTGTVTATPQR